MNRHCKYAFKAAAWLVGILAILWGGAFLAVLAVNWNDQPPSEAVEWFSDMYQTRPVVVDADNGFVHVMGFMAAQGEDPRAWGARRIAAFHGQAEDMTQDDWDDPLSDVFDPTDLPSFPATPQALLEAVANAPPLSVFTPNSAQELLPTNDAENTVTEQDILRWLDEGEWLLRRYLDLLAHPDWLETAPFHIQCPPPHHQGVLQGQKLLLIQAWVLTGQGDAVGAHDLLERDILFWRRVLVNTDSLFTKFFATRAISNHFLWGNIALRRIAPDLSTQAVPISWTTPVTAAERSLDRPLMGEWLAVDNNLRQVHAQGSAAETIRVLFAKINLGRALLFPLIHLQPQDTSNTFADTYRDMLHALNANSDPPYPTLPQAMAAADDILRNAVDAANILNHPGRLIYNPLGRLLFAITVNNFTPHVPDLADLEGRRRAALLAATLRVQGVLPDQVAYHLDHPSLRNPYGSEPFQWDEEARAIVFHGLAGGGGEPHTYIY